MKVGILKTGRPPKPAIDAFGTYPDMFMRLLGPEAYDWRTYDVDGGELPAAPEDCAAFIVTGSAAGVYETDPWIGALLDFLRNARGRTKLVGVCFGHQAMAQAFGGWGIGAHDYQVVGSAPWMEQPASAIRLPASHQDQVVELPPGADVIVSSAFTPMAGLAWRDHSAISIQPHPEFDPAYATALIEARRGKIYADDEADRAVASFAGPDDRERVGRWIGAFLRS